VVSFGPEVVDGAAEQPPLDAGLDEEGEVAEPERLEGGDRTAEVAPAAVLLREQQPRPLGLAEGDGLLQRARPVFLDRDPVDGEEPRVVGEVRPGLVADLGVPTVEDASDARRVRSRLGLGPRLHVLLGHVRSPR
jgi:hypothetical protein